MAKRKMTEPFLVREIPEDYWFIDYYVSILLDTVCVARSDRCLYRHLDAIQQSIHARYPLFRRCDVIEETYAHSYGRNYVK